MIKNKIIKSTAIKTTTKNSKKPKITITYKDKSLTFGPGESQDIIKFLKTEWPYKFKKNGKTVIIWEENKDINELLR